MKSMVRLMVLVGLVLLFLLGASSLMAAAPAGTNPDDGLAPTCTSQSLDPGASVWIKVPYQADDRLQFNLDAFGVSGVKFDVYASATASSPIGTGSYDQNEPTHSQNWEGRLQQNGFFYVLVTNTNPFAVPYRFCVNQKDPFHSFGYTMEPGPAPCPAHETGDLLGATNHRDCGPG